MFVSKGFYGEFSKSILKLVFAGVVIGVTHQYDIAIALILVLIIARNLHKNIERKDDFNKIAVIGMIITGVLGVVVEYWGVTNEYWSYHNLSNGRSFPYWLPFAWMLAFSYLYIIEKKILKFLRNKNLRNKISIIILVATVFPVLGEIITINLGVWTYYWPYQILGIPMYAVFGLLTLHMFVNLILVIICKRFKIEDPIFTLKTI